MARHGVCSRGLPRSFSTGETSRLARWRKQISRRQAGFTRGHGVIQSSGRAPVIRDRVGRDKRNRFSTYQVLCSSTRAYAGVRVGVFARRRRGGERAVDTVEVRGEGPGSRVNSSHGLLPFAAPSTRGRHQGLGAGWRASPLLSIAQDYLHETMLESVRPKL